MQTDSEGLIVLKSQLESNRSGLGGWSPATVIRVNAVRTAQGVVKSSTYDIQYDDGAVEKGVDIRFLRARSSLASTSTLSDTHCSVLEGHPTTHDTGIPLANTPGKKGAAEEGREVAGGDGNDGVRYVVAGGVVSSIPGATVAPTASTAPSTITAAALSSAPSKASVAPSAATTTTTTAATGDMHVDNAAKDGPAKLAAPLNRPTLSKSPSSSALSSAARAVSYSHSSSRQETKSNRAVGGDAGAGAGSAAGTTDNRAGTRQVEANKIIRQSYPSLEDPQYDSDREFTRSSFKAPLTAAERGPGSSRAVVKRSLQGREQLKNFFRDSTSDPLKEGGKRLSAEVVKEPLQEQVRVRVMRTAATHTHSDTDGGAAPSQGIQTSEEQSSKVKTVEQAIKQQQQQLPSSLPLSSLPSQSSIGRAGGSPVTKQVPRALDGADMLQTRDKKTGEIGKTQEQAPIVNQAGQSAPDLVRKMTASEAVSPVAAAGDAVFDDMEVGSRVEGNYADIGEWFTGRISKKWRDGSYDIQYDDGDREVGVRPPLVRLLKTAQ